MLGLLCTEALNPDEILKLPTACYASSICSCSCPWVFTAPLEGIRQTMQLPITSHLEGNSH